MIIVSNTPTITRLGTRWSGNRYCVAKIFTSLSQSVVDKQLKLGRPFMSATPSTKTNLCLRHLVVFLVRSRPLKSISLSYHKRRSHLFDTNNKQCRMLSSTGNNVDTLMDNKSTAAVSTNENISTSIPTAPSVGRSKKLASIIRDGVVMLNQSAATIQNNVETTKSILTSSSADDANESNAKQLAEEHRILTTAQKCLDEICMKDDSFPLMAGDEPILLLGVRVNKAFTHADLYWSLPYVVLTAEELNDRQREYLKEKMSERVHGTPGKMLLQRVNAVLSYYYPPKIRFKAAPPILVHNVIHDLDED